MADQSLVGKVGAVVHAVGGGERCGEVKVVVQGLPHYYVAYAVEPIPVGAQVLVVNNRGARQLDVELWDPPGP